MNAPALPYTVCFLSSKGICEGGLKGKAWLWCVGASGHGSIHGWIHYSFCHLCHLTQQVRMLLIHNMSSVLWTALRDRLPFPGSLCQKDAKTSVFSLPLTHYMLINETCLFPAPGEAEMNWAQNCLVFAFHNFFVISVYLVLIHWLRVLILALEPSQEHKAEPSQGAFREQLQPYCVGMAHLSVPAWFINLHRLGKQGPPSTSNPYLLCPWNLRSFSYCATLTFPSGKFFIKFKVTKELPRGPVVVLSAKETARFPLGHVLNSDWTPP